MTFDEWWEKCGRQEAYGSCEHGGLDKSGRQELAELAYNVGHNEGYERGQDAGENGYSTYN